MKTNYRAFTLIELLILMAVVAVIIGAVVSGISHLRANKGGIAESPLLLEEQTSEQNYALVPDAASDRPYYPHSLWTLKANHATLLAVEAILKKEGYIFKLSGTNSIEIVKEH